MPKVEEKMIFYGGAWHIAALDKFSWPAARYESLPGADKASGESVDFTAWGDRDGHLICLPGQEELVEELPSDRGYPKRDAAT